MIQDNIKIARTAFMHGYVKMYVAYKCGTQRMGMCEHVLILCILQIYTRVHSTNVVCMAKQYSMVIPKLCVLSCTLLT